MAGYEKHYLQKCKSCGFVFCSRKPTEGELVDHYNLYPRGNDISPITIKRYEVLLDAFEKYRKNNNMIDVGCGDGHFLQVAKRRGWNVFGTEYTDVAVEVCEKKGISMKKGKLNVENYPPDYFDVVTSFEVIEHINNPNEDVANYNKVLRKGGVVYVTTPNFNSVSRDLLGVKWNVIEYPEHLSYYTVSTIKEIFVKNGFKPLAVMTSGISIDRLKAGLRKTNVDVNSAPAPAIASDETLRQNAESNGFYKLAIRIVNGMLNVTRKGDSLKGIFEKQREV